MRAVIVLLLAVAALSAQPKPSKHNLKPIAVSPPGTTSAVITVPEVAYWKLMKLASDDEANRLRGVLIQSDRGAIIIEICSGVGLKIAECQISQDGRTVTKR